MNQNPPDGKRVCVCVGGGMGVAKSLKCVICDCVYLVYEINKYMQVNKRLHYIYGKINTHAKEN